MSVKSLGKESLIYGVGHIITRSIAFLLLPIYTNAFSLEDYGILSLIYTFLGFMNVILHYGLDASLLKHYVPADQEDKKSILTNTYASFMVTTIVFIIIMILLRNHVSELLFGVNLLKITLLVLGILFFDVLWAIQQKFKAFDFGIFTVNENPNMGLARFKENFGASGVFRDTIELNIF